MARWSLLEAATGAVTCFLAASDSSRVSGVLQNIGRPILVY